MQAQHPSYSGTEATTIPLKVGATSRGFPRIEFADHYNEQCSVQLSSLADTPAIWFGVDSPKVQTQEAGGWQAVSLPTGAVISGRMHLSHEHVRALLPYLQTFVETGDLLPLAPKSQPSQQFLAEIKRTSKYAHQANMMRNHAMYTYPFRCVIDGDDGGEYVVKGGIGGQYRLADVNLYVVTNGRKIRLK
ncbi:hypothetical protein HX870_24420 [Pseudomonas gingeri]|uniref:hypothetical protein n=1 Tax=Pseudomonas gingeri TaxID=117681 RepID=UPI0015A38A63|nr:hypothetical protein [Pseudomonas gingeri]NWD70748.1 hypothetical protein [Pseudomonas gingeri]